MICSANVAENIHIYGYLFLKNTAAGFSSVILVVGAVNGVYRCLPVEGMGQKMDLSSFILQEGRYSRSARFFSE